MAHTIPEEAQPGVSGPGSKCELALELVDSARQDNGVRFGYVRAVADGALRRRIPPFSAAGDAVRLKCLNGAMSSEASADLAAMIPLPIDLPRTTAVGQSFASIPAHLVLARCWTSLDAGSVAAAAAVISAWKRIKLRQGDLRARFTGGVHLRRSGMVRLGSGKEETARHWHLLALRRECGADNILRYFVFSERPHASTDAPIRKSLAPACTVAASVMQEHDLPGGSRAECGHGRRYQVRFGCG